MFKLYVDPAADDITILTCGMLATVEAWDGLCAAWNDVLAEPPSLPHWHASDAWARQPPFDKLTREEREYKEKSLANVILDIQPRPFALSAHMLRATFDKHVKGKMRVPRSSETKSRHKTIERLLSWEHAVGVNGVLAGLTILLEQTGIKDDVHVVFESDNDERDAFVHGIGQLMPHFLKQLDSPAKDQIKGITASRGKRKETRPLEAADLYAWCRLRNLSKRNGPEVIQLAGERLPPVWEYELTSEKMDARVQGFMRDAWGNKGQAPR